MTMEGTFEVRTPTTIVSTRELNPATVARLRDAMKIDPKKIGELLRGLMEQDPTFGPRLQAEGFDVAALSEDD